MAKTKKLPKKIFVEGIPITGDSSIKIYSDKELRYNYLKLNNLYLNSLDYETSGIIKLNNGKVIVELNQEEFKISKFKGNLEIRNNIFKIEGLIKKTNLGIVDVKAVSKKTKSNNSKN